MVQLQRLQEDAAGEGSGAGGTPGLTRDTTSNAATSGSSSSSSDSIRLRRIRVQVASSDLALLKPDIRQMCQARYGILAAAETQLSVFTAGGWLR